VSRQLQSVPVSEEKRKKREESFPQVREDEERKETASFLGKRRRRGHSHALVQ